ncbi:hypothetical protein OHB53_22765 [Streptomyces sp. NBC_00056]|uniref:hypothetical protein n=1 Tax=unclassified Streptomyces TaxID=2593676 RepID=UPI002258D70B|nr:MULTISPECIES: hypothetical protein [unclassified Streptomyces]MCX5438762.1 hypothetical protein [Streptomyces sp. NBC_00063]WUB94727.1 hypothetical protein OHO83_21765 [Streptomyces sp. NBC_00569]
MTRLPSVISGGPHAQARPAAAEEQLATVPGGVALHHGLSTAAQGTAVRTLRDATGVLATKVHAAGEPVPEGLPRAFDPLLPLLEV